MIPVFFRPEQSCDAAVGYSPSAGKPSQVIVDWSLHFGNDMQIETFNPATLEMMCEAHDPEYVDAVMNGHCNNGFGNCDPQVAESLRYTVGSMIAAAKHVLNAAGERRVACSPTSGFHHAGYASGGGFCTFNGLMVTALWLKRLGLVNRVGIIDMDFHYGNGTQDIIDTLDCEWVTHWTHGGAYESAREALSLVGKTKQFSQDYPQAVDLVLYQAGADQHIDDPLGGLLTTEEMAQRDRRVFRACRQYGIPVVWNLAGGYQRDDKGSIEPVLALHRQTMAICIEEFL
jgi:acetoin utilization deacetylase AcuC-like enzyme